jgi:hypothetical protein
MPRLPFDVVVDVRCPVLVAPGAGVLVVHPRVRRALPALAVAVRLCLRGATGRPPGKQAVRRAAREVLKHLVLDK